MWLFVAVNGRHFNIIWFLFYSDYVPKELGYTTYMPFDHFDSVAQDSTQTTSECPLGNLHSAQHVRKRCLGASLSIKAMVNN